MNTNSCLMKSVVVIGLGSMGKRRVRLLLDMYPNIRIVGIDSRVDRRVESETMFSICTYADLNSAMLDHEKPFAAIICTSPSEHAHMISDCLDRGMHVFSELNLIDEGYAENQEKARRMGLKLFLSSTMLYRGEIDVITNELKSVGNVAYRYHVGQYLPNWHPWEAVKDFFVSDVRTNGCRELFAIELPWISNAFGEIISCTSWKGNYSRMNLGYPDTYTVVIEHVGGTVGTVNVDVVSRCATRNLEIFSEDIHIVWEGTPRSLRKYDVTLGEMKSINTYKQVIKDERYADNIIENAYLDELYDFAKYIFDEEHTPRYSFDVDYKILKIIDQIEGVI